MPYLIVLLPFLACVGVIGAVVSLVRGRRRSALLLAIVGVGAIMIVILLSSGGASEEVSLTQVQASS